MKYTKSIDIGMVHSVCRVYSDRYIGHDDILNSWSHDHIYCY